MRIYVDCFKNPRNENKREKKFSAWLTGTEQFQKARYHSNDNLEKGNKEILSILNLDYSARHFTKKKRENKKAKKIEEMFLQEYY